MSKRRIKIEGFSLIEVLISMKRAGLKEKKTSLPRQGMTLVETLVGLVIMSMFVASVLSFYAKGQQGFFQGNVRSDVLEKVRYSLVLIGRDASLANSAARKFESTWASTSVLILNLPCLDANGDVREDTPQTDCVVYSVTNNRLVRSCTTWPQSYREGGDKVLADQIAGLHITYYDAADNILTDFTQATSVRVEVIASTNVGSRNFQQALSSRLTLRNKLK